MSPEDVARGRAQRIADPAARCQAEVAAAQLGVHLRAQEGVVGVRQLREAGLAKSDVARLLRQRVLRRVHRGVYLDHTGPLSRDQQVWAAILYAEPAVICGPTLLGWDDGVVHVAIDASRRLESVADVHVRRVRELDRVAQWKALPPRMRREDNVVAMVDEAGSELDAVRLLTDASRERDIGIERLRRAVTRRSRLRRRAFVVAVLQDIATGAQSVLEWGYLTAVERAHGLPRPDRQTSRRTPGGKQYRDVEYDEFALVVELDGRLNHDSWEAENRDADRELDDHAEGKVTVRLRWKQVLGTPCATAARVATVLQRRGWKGRPTRCGPACQLDRGV